MNDPFSFLGSTGYGNQIRGYPPASDLEPTDAFLIDRVGQGSLQLLASVLIASLGSNFADVNLANVVSGTLGGSVNIDTSATTDPFNFNMFSGLTFLTANQQTSVSTSEHLSDGRATVGLSRYASGSGVDGPQGTDAAMLVYVEKTGGPGGNQAGEIDGIYVHGIQNQNGDIAAFLAEVEKTGYENGGGVSFEGQARRTDTSGNVYQSADGILAFSEALEPDYGAVCVLEARVGTVRTGILIDTFDESDLFPIPPATPPSLTDAFTLRAARSANFELYKIDGLGNTIQGNPTDRMVTKYDTTLHGLRKYDTTGTVALDLFNQAGQYFVNESIQAAYFVSGPYTVSSVPNATTAGQGATITVSNGYHGQPCIAVSIGGVWLAGGPLSTPISAT